MTKSGSEVQRDGLTRDEARKLARKLANETEEAQVIYLARFRPAYDRPNEYGVVALADAQTRHLDNAMESVWPNSYGGE